MRTVKSRTPWSETNERRQSVDIGTGSRILLALWGWGSAAGFLGARSTLASRGLCGLVDAKGNPLNSEQGVWDAPYPQYYGPDEAKWVKPEDELEEIELGERVCWFILTGKLAGLYSGPPEVRFDWSVFAPYGARHDANRLYPEPAA